MKKIFLFVLGVVFLFGIISSVSAFVWYPNETITYNNFSQTSGNILDITGHGFDGTNSGGDRGLTGKKGYGINFSETNDYANFSTLDTALNSDYLSFNVWIKPNVAMSSANTHHMYFFNIQDMDGDSKLVMGYTSTGKIWFYARDDLGANSNLQIVKTYSAATWYMITGVVNKTHILLYENGVEIGHLKFVADPTFGFTAADYFVMSNDRDTFTDSWDGMLDEFSISNKSYSAAEITSLYNSGNGRTYTAGGGAPPAPEIDVTINYPVNDSVFSSQGIFFNATYNISTEAFNWTNTTYFIWHANGTLFNKTTISISGQDTTTKKLIDSFVLGNYFYNILAVYQNSSNIYSIWASNTSNYSLTIGATILNEIHSNHTFETKLETFNLMIDLIEGTELSLAQLIYNGTIYSISNIIHSGTNYTLSKTIDIPLNLNPLGNQTNSFYYKFTYEGETTQNTQLFYQNVSFINLGLCGGDSANQTLNFTFVDELTQAYINATAHPIDFQAAFYYWLGSGSLYKNSSYLSLAAAIGNYKFCMYPVWEDNFYGDKGMSGSMIGLSNAVGYSERQYYINNATLTNETSHTLLYLLNESNAVKFTIDVKEGTNLVEDAYVTISKFFIGDGTYKTISIRKTDDQGEFVEYLELDRDYRYYIVKNGELKAIKEKRATCDQAPCEFSLQIDGEQGNIWQGWLDYYAGNVASNLSFDSTTKIVTYEFLDLTGLATYFRLEVDQVYMNETEKVICNSYSYSSSGTLTCNVSGYGGDFIAKTYVSRSPEKVDKVLSFIIGEIKEAWGLMSIVFCLGIIITLTFTGASISRGNPSVILFFFGLSILATKLMTILPFSWGIVSVIELIVIVVIALVKT